jgi:predicted RNA-binding protein with TRAM domain
VPTCGGDGIVISETSAAVDIERRLRALAAGSRHQAYRVEVAAKIASILIGPAASRLIELEKQTRRRFYLEPKEDVHLDHFLVLEEGKRDDLAPPAPVSEGSQVELSLVEVGLHDADAGVGKLDGFDVSVAGAAKLVGKKVNVEIERVLDGTAYATLVDTQAAADAPITAESEAEKPTRRTSSAAQKDAEAEAPETEERDEREEQAEAAPKKKTRRGSRGGRGRKKKTAAAAKAGANGAGEPKDVPAPAGAKIHVPAPELGGPAPPEEEEEAAPEATSENGEETPKPKKKTRRGTRGGRSRKKKTAATKTAATVVAAEEKPEQKDWEYVPMSEWGDDVGE